MTAVEVINSYASGLDHPFEASGAGQAIVESHKRDGLFQLFLKIQAAGKLDGITGAQRMSP